VNIGGGSHFHAANEGVSAAAGDGATCASSADDMMAP